jgi:carbon-monoxide dehydrogenase catalytic subunit
MLDNEIKNSFSGSAATMRGDQTTFGTKLTNEDSNDPNTHTDIHNRINIDYNKINKSPSMEDVHNWQREHIKVNDQSKEGYPMNVILDPAMREMYQVVHDSGLTNVFDRFKQQQPIQCKFCIRAYPVNCGQWSLPYTDKVPRGTCGLMPIQWLQGILYTGMSP